MALKNGTYAVFGACSAYFPRKTEDSDEAGWDVGILEGVARITNGISDFAANATLGKRLGFFAGSL